MTEHVIPGLILGAALMLAAGYGLGAALSRVVGL